MVSQIEKTYASILFTSKPYRATPAGLNKSLKEMLFTGGLLARLSPDFASMSSVKLDDYSGKSEKLVNDVKEAATIRFDDAIKNHQKAVKDLYTRLSKKDITEEETDRIWAAVNDAKAITREARRVEIYARTLPAIYKNNNTLETLKYIGFILSSSNAYEEDRFLRRVFTYHYYAKFE